MNYGYLTDHPIGGDRRRRNDVAQHRKLFDLRALLESLGWVLAGATVGSIAVMCGAWGLTQWMTQRRITTPPPVTAMAYPAPSALPPH